MITNKLISNHDLQIITDLVTVHEGKGGSFFIERLHYIFGSEFTINHCIALGYVIGEIEGAEKTLTKLQTNLNACVQN